MKTCYKQIIGRSWIIISTVFVLLSISGFVFAQSTVTVSGGGTTGAGANGTYNYAGTTNVDGTVRKYFDMPSSVYRIEFRHNSGYGVNEWEIWESTARGGGGTVRFYHTSTAAIIPSGAWQVDVASGSPYVTYSLNETPVLASIEGTTLSYSEGNAATAITSTISVSDADDANIESATVQITGSYQNGQDVLSFTNQNGISGTWTAGTGLMALSGSSTKANYQTALQSVKYNNTSQDPSTTTRTVSFTVNDGDANSNTQTRNISVTSVNDEPTLTATGTNPTFTENGSASDLYSTVSISTVESGQTITQLVLTVTNVTNGANEILAIDGSDVALTNGNSLTTATNSMSVTVSVTGSTATVTISKVAGISAASMQTLVDGMTYRNTSHPPNTSNRVVTLTSVKDNGGTTNDGDDTATLSISSTVTVVATTPTVTFTNGGNAALNFVQTNAVPSQVNWLLGQFSLAGDATGATLSSVTVTLAGMYDPGDLASNPFQLYASNANNFSGASALGSSVADPGTGSDVTFSSLSDVIPSGTRYYWVTADISATATSDDNINGTISVAGNLSISGGTLGTSNYGKLNAGSDASLPVSLVSFSARSEGRSVILEWITESETDNLGFILERSVGADYNPPGDVGSGWQPIATYQTHDALKGQGNTSSRTEYTFTDQTVESGKSYSYRLSDVSTKGEITVYASLSVKMDNLPETTEMKNAYPNPFNPQTYIAYNLSEDTDVSITVFDMLGRNVKSLYTGHQLAGSYNVYWNATDGAGNKVPSGGYIIQMKTEKTRLTQKVMLMK